VGCRASRNRSGRQRWPDRPRQQRERPHDQPTPR
jgi:hypothetical protein